MTEMRMTKQKLRVHTWGPSQPNHTSGRAENNEKMGTKYSRGTETQTQTRRHDSETTVKDSKSTNQEEVTRNKLRKNYTI